MQQKLGIICFVMLLWPLISVASEPARHTVVADGHPLTVWEKSADNPTRTMLLLHGRTYSSLPDFDLRWEGGNLSFMDELTRRGFQVFALDARGYGATGRDSSGWLTPDRAARDVRAVIDWLNKKTGRKVHIYGWSYGSMVAQLVGQRNTNGIASLMLFGYPFNPERHVLPIDHQYPLAPPRKANTAEHAASDFITPDAISDSAIQAYVRQALKADPIRVDFKNLHEWAELDPRKVTLPTLLMQAEFDPIAPDAIQAALFNNLGTNKKWWVVLEWGDHAALLETPRIEMLDVMATFAGHASRD